VRRAVESGAADLEAPVVLVGDPVQVCHLRQGRVERGVEHRDLRHAVAQELARRANAPQVRRVVQRRQLDAILDARDHVVVDAHRGPEALPAVNHAVPDRMDVGHRAHRFDARVGRDDPAQDPVHCLPMVAQRRVLESLLPTLCLKHDQRVARDALDPPVGQATIGVGGGRRKIGLDQLESDTRGPAVQNEDVHQTLSTRASCPSASGSATGTGARPRGRRPARTGAPG